MILNEITLWFFGVAVLFTVVGYFWGSRTQTKNIVSVTVDNLINEGYLKTHGTGNDMVILKWREWENDKTN